VVSPLISLMKDQVDSLIDCGVAAAAVNSTLLDDERRRVAADIRAQRLKLLYLAPERLCTERMLDFLQQQALSFFAIDEAHCISSWGHDFRVEYRMLGGLRQRFPAASLHAYTATATEPVRADIVAQLGLRQPEVLVGDFDRPNLSYRVQARRDLDRQIAEVLQRHRGEAGIIYCIARREVDDLAARLQRAGVRAVAYHAGLADAVRHRHQDAFLNELADVVVATVAFGMGIDKPDVRFVIHAAAPKSLEHYQQETGRAGRDGLDAECCLFYGGNDFQVWRRMQSDLPPAAAEQALASLRVMEQYCTAVTCRHRALVEHFGQRYATPDCAACDVCLDQIAVLPESLVVAQKILSCVLRVRERFGADYVAEVLIGSEAQRILDNRHQTLSTYGLLRPYRKATVREWIEQLCGQGSLKREEEHRTLSLSETGRQVLRGELTPRLLPPRPARATPLRKGLETLSVEIDRGLLERLRQLRRDLARDRNVASFIVFGDRTLHDLAARRPTTLANFRQAHGVGEHKSEHYGTAFTAAIADYCAEHGLETDRQVGVPIEHAESADIALPRARSAARSAADALFREGRPVAEVAAALDRAMSTTMEYLAEFLSENDITDPTPWLDPALFARIRTVSGATGLERLKPIFEALEGTVSYEQIRIAVACLRRLNQPMQEAAPLLDRDA
ncbi:MAG: RecQ family ATP-dependent DNA helicase, partial [Gammaproteobacteria bacterium]